MRDVLRATWLQFCKLINVCLVLFLYFFLLISSSNNNGNGCGDMGSILLQFSPPVRTSLREKAIAVAGRVTIVKDRESSKVSCPVCFEVVKVSDGADLRMALALHLSLWHPDDVKLQWDIMQRQNESSVHVPSLIIGVGVAVGFGALVAISARNRTQKLPC